MPDTLAGSLRSLSPGPASRARIIAERVSARSKGQWRGRLLIVGERLFRDALGRERKRADRFAESFVLVVVSSESGRPPDASLWKPVLDALSVAARLDTDVLGWLEQGSALGMIVPQLGPTDAPLTREVESRLRPALASCLDEEAWSRFSIRLHRYSSPRPGEQVNPLLQMPHAPTRTRLHSALKRAVDVTAGALLLGLLSPLFLIIAALIKLTSPGPVFFRQVRVGEFGKPFTMLKFRTMRDNNDEAIHREFVNQLINGATPSGGDSVDAPFKIANDPRVTPIGPLLRRTSLDELPQFWNVLRGEMSLVGPRPPLQYEVEQYQPWHYRRLLEAKPGITGLWQVSGRSRTTFDEMVRLDLRYAKSSSPWTDVKILLATPRAAVSGKGAC